MEPKPGAGVLPNGWMPIDWSKPERATVSLATAAKVLGVRPVVISRMAREGTLPTISVGRRKVVSRLVLERILTSGTN